MTIHDLQDELQASRKRIEVLLVMVGEKDEEYEALMGDMKEVKNLYRAQMEELLERVTAPTPSSSTPTSGMAGSGTSSSTGTHRGLHGSRGSSSSSSNTIVQTMS
jgi:hypothetical protein